VFTVRQLAPGDFGGVAALGRKIYPQGTPWQPEQLSSHLRIFPEGQFVVIEDTTDALVGYAATLIVFWNDYEMESDWRDFTGGGMFTNHDPVKGRTLYAADIMVDPDCQGKGAGKMLYAAREHLLRRLRLLRIRAGARLQGYHRYRDTLTPEAYVRGIVAGEYYDATLSFQLKQGFKVLGVVANYMRHDPMSLGFAAVIEYLNPEVATKEHMDRQRQSSFYA
jgi:GNAT superfamily N-acetyltransferase